MAHVNDSSEVGVKGDGNPDTRLLGDGPITAQHDACYGTVLWVFLRTIEHISSIVFQNELK